MAPLDEIPHAGYREAICAELAVRARELEGRELVSIYVGGGTPSIWEPAELAAALAAVAARFGAADQFARGDLEVTLEANPIDCQPDRLDAWRAAGVNRLSIGVQSIEAGALAVLGRDHAMGDGLAALDAAAGRFDSLSGDVILGTPGARGALATVEALADRGLDHLSVYELTIEEGAPLGRAVARGEVTPLDPDALGDLYIAARELLIDRGYEHYEISSYARPGRRARHNSLYWSGAEYLGLGASASSFRRDPGGGGARWSNHRSVGRYLAAPPDRRIAERRELDAEACARDRVWLGMRTADGFEAAVLGSFAGGAEVERFLLDAQLARVTGDRITPTLRGFLFADRVAARVVGYSWDPGS